MFVYSTRCPDCRRRCRTHATIRRGVAALEEASEPLKANEFPEYAGRSHNIKIDNSAFERVEEFKYLGTTLKNENSIQEESKSRLKSGIACYHSVQNLLSSSLLSKFLKIKI